LRSAASGAPARTKYSGAIAYATAGRRGLDARRPARYPSTATNVRTTATGAVDDHGTRWFALPHHVVNQVSLHRGTTRASPRQCRQYTSPRRGASSNQPCPRHKTGDIWGPRVQPGRRQLGVYYAGHTQRWEPSRSARRPAYQQIAWRPRRRRRLPRLHRKAAPTRPRCGVKRIACPPGHQGAGPLTNVTLAAGRRPLCWRGGRHGRP